MKTRFKEILLDIKFLKSSKADYLISKFGNFPLATKGAYIKPKHCIARIILKCQLQQKHRQKKRLKKETKSISIQLKLTLTVLVSSALLHKTIITVKSRWIAVT